MFNIKKSLMRYSVFAVCVLIVITFTAFIVSSYIAHGFRVIYSLDRKQNSHEIVKIIDNADKYVYFAIYYFTKNDIADALIRAQKRGVKVLGIMDREASEGSNKFVLEKLRNAGVSVEVQRHLDGIMHMKVLVTERAYASGSYNWTETATQSNDEILEIGKNEIVREKYLAIVEKVLKANQ